MRPALTSRKKNGTVYRYYVCYNAVNHGYHSCPVASVPADMLEGYALERLQTVLQQPEVYAKTWRTAQQRLQQEVEQLQAAERSLLARIEATQRTLAAETGAEGANEGGLHLDVAHCERQLAETRDSLRECRSMVVTESALVQALSRVDALWGFLQEHEKARLFQLVFKKVVVRSDQIEVQFRDNGLSNLVRELEITGD